MCENHIRHKLIFKLCFYMSSDMSEVDPQDILAL